MKTTLLKLVSLLLISFALPSYAEPVKDVSIWVARDVAPGPKVRLTINTRNVPIVKMAAYRLKDVKVLIDRDRLRKMPAVPGKPVREWSTNLAAYDRPNVSQRDIFRSRQVNLPPLPPGIYLLTATGDGKRAWAVVNVTQLAVVVKRSPKRMLTWVTDASTGKVVKDAEVVVYGKNNEKVKTGVTGTDGISVFPLPPGTDQTVLVTHRGDLAAVPIGVTTTEGELKVHFQTDRPIYRPGQSVSFKAIVRRTNGRGYKPVSDTVCQLEIRDSRDNALLEKKMTTNPLGTLAGDFDIPSEAATGAYTIVLSIGKESAYETFSVAEYRKPEFKASVTLAEKRYLAGQEIEFEVKADYFFGAPVPGAQVNYSVRRIGSPYGCSTSEDDWFRNGDGNLYAHDTYYASPFVAEGTVSTDSNGTTRIPIKTDKDAPDSVYRMECRVRDTSRREVQASGSVPVFAASIRLSTATDVLVTPLGSNIPLTLKAVDLDGKPAPAEVTLVVKEPVWNKNEERYDYRELTRTGVSISKTGKANAKVPAKAEGELIIMAEARDKTGRKTSSRISVWVAGPGGRVEKEQKGPSLDLKLDRRSYTPGDTAKAWVGSNTADRPMLLTAEGSDIWDYKVLPSGTKSFLWNVRTSAEMSPNAYAAAAQWTRAGLVSANALIAVPDPSEKLKVSVAADRTAYRPGDKAVYTVRTTDLNGKPVPAEVAVSVVDEAIYALHPDTTSDLYKAFWGTRPNFVITGYSAPEEQSGGAYQRVSSMAPVRQRFLDTAYWNAHVLTGEDGVAKITFEFPGNLTTWRATARAVTSDTRVGAQTSDVQVSRPVMLRLATPRQIVQGDRLVLIGTVNNRTDRPHTFETAISAEGLKVEGETTKRVRAPAHGEATVEWTIAADTLPESGQAFITGRTLAVDAPADRAEDYSDALRVEVRVAPKGIAYRYMTGGVVEKEKTVTLDLPADRIEPAANAVVVVRTGLSQVVDELVRDVLEDGRYGSPGAADNLIVAVVSGLNTDSGEVRESLAALSRYQTDNGGWGWWEDSGSNPAITAHVLTALALARSAGIRVPQGLMDRGISGAAYLYSSSNLWEDRVLLASAIAPTGEKESEKRLDEVLRRGENMSPYAQLVFADTLSEVGKRDDAVEITKQVMKDAVVGPETAYVPAGEHPGWYATTVETTAQALITLLHLSQRSDLQPKLAQWLADPENCGWLSHDEKALSAEALGAYIRRHPVSDHPGSPEVTVNGTKLEYPAKEDKAARILVPRSLLKSGENVFIIKRTGSGEAFFTVDVSVFRPVETETTSGVRVIRRYEVESVPGVWHEVDGSVKPSVPVRCSVMVWPDDRAEAVRVVEPVPAGFEFVDSENTGDTRSQQEVRDGAVVHYFCAAGRPAFFRYYLRAESEGTVTALPAEAEAIRRPSVRGNSALEILRVEPAREEKEQ